MKRNLFALIATAILMLFHAQTIAAAASCEVSTQFSEEAERKPGGSLNEGPPTVHHGTHGSHDQQKMQMPEMKGAHMDHNSRHGGSFFMAPDKMHHLEATYSKDCGIQVFFFNAFTEAIRADRFRAFVTVVPASEDEPELIRFLSPSKNGAILETGIGNTVTRPFDIKLYVKFPETDEPELFSIKVKAGHAAAVKADTTAALAIKNGNLVGSKVVRVKQGQTVELRWSSDEAVELHLHGYDIVAKPKPGAPAVMRFKAHATGRYPVTAHGHGHGDGHAENTMLYLEVHPN